MRAAEYGLRALARERRVAFPKKPLEWAALQELLTQIEISARALLGPGCVPGHQSGSRLYEWPFSQDQ
jgi:hypothetical protein